MPNTNPVLPPESQTYNAHCELDPSTRCHAKKIVLATSDDNDNVNDGSVSSTTTNTAHNGILHTVTN